MATWELVLADKIAIKKKKKSKTKPNKTKK